MPRISRFSPNWSDPDTLEAITVAREDLISAAVDAVRDSSLTKNKHHLLFVGPRGSGKTHLITLIHHRVTAMSEVMENLRIAWLNEDETSDTLLSLLLRVHRALAKEYPEQFPAESIEPIYDLTNPDEAGEAIAELLLKQLANHTLLILVENLDAVFAEFNDGEQKRWRALIQNHPQFCTVGTAQRLFAEVSDRDAPFFGFFDVSHLKPFSVADAAELLTKVAREKDDSELAHFIASPRGRARLRALHHLTGGNQRLFIILSEFIERESLESLVHPFEELVDEQLTPYYQERLRWLPTLQRKIVEFLCSIAKPQSVKDIARKLFSTSQTISSQLGKLREMGYVQSRKRGRESLYELAEPLMRLSHEVKEAKGRTPLRILVDFLRVWYDQEELEQRLQLAPKEAAITRMYFSEFRELSETGGNLRLQMFREEADGLDLTECDEQSLALLRDLKDESDQPGDILKYGLALGHCDRNQEAVDAFTTVIERNDARAEHVAMALVSRGVALGVRGDTEAAIADYSSVIKRDDALATAVAWAFTLRGAIHDLRGDTEAAIADYSSVIERDDAPPEQVAKALINRGIAQGQRGNTRAAITDYSAVIEDENASAERVAMALVNRGATLGQRGDTKAEIADYSAVIERGEFPTDQKSRAHFNTARAEMQRGRWKEAETHLRSGFALVDQPDSVYLGPVPSYIHFVLNSGQTRKVWAPIVDMLIDIYAENKALTRLAAGLADSLGGLRDSSLSTKGLSDWHALWAERAEAHPELELPTRLLRTAIDYFAAEGEESVLFDLPSEERRILAQALGLEDQATDPIEN